MFRNCLKRRLDGQREPLPKLGANVVIPSPRFQQIPVRLNSGSLQVSRRPAAVSQFLEQPRPDLLPGDDIGGILLMPLDAVI